MKDISSYFSKLNESKTKNEFIWDELRFKVILFKDGEPVSYYPLKDEENNMNGALKAASGLLNGDGVVLNTVAK